MELTQEKLMEIASSADAIATKTDDRPLKVQWGHLAGVARNLAGSMPATEKDVS